MRYKPKFSVVAGLIAEVLSNYDQPYKTERKAYRLMTRVHPCCAINTIVASPTYSTDLAMSRVLKRVNLLTIK